MTRVVIIALVLVALVIVMGGIPRMKSMFLASLGSSLKSYKNSLGRLRGARQEPHPISLRLVLWTRQRLQFIVA